jgi:hypothetical protein
VEVLMKLGELVVVPLMEDAKSLAAFILSSADLSQSFASAATTLDSFLSPALLGLPVPPTPDSPPSSSSPASGAFVPPSLPQQMDHADWCGGCSADAGAMMDMPRLDRRGSTEALPIGVMPGDHRAGLALTMEEEAALSGANGWGHVIQSLSSVPS